MNGMFPFYGQLCIPLVLMFFRFPKRSHFWVKFALLTCLTFVGAYFIPEPTEWGNFPPEIGYFIFYLSGYLIASASVYLLINLPLLTTLFYLSVAFLVQNLGHHLYSFLCRILDVSVEVQYTDWRYLLLFATIYVVIYLLFLLLLKKLKIKEITTVPKGSSLFLSLSFLLIMIVLGVYMRYINASINSDRGASLIYELYSCLIDVLIISISLGIFRNQRLINDKEELELKLDTESKYYKMAQSTMESINIRCHDLKHQINAIGMMEDDEEKRKQLEELKKDVLLYDDIAKTNNPSLDYILTEKTIYCHKHQIAFSVIANGDDIGFMECRDIYSLFGNAIDNAIESELKISEKQKRVISLKICNRNGMIFIHLENYCLEEPRFKDGLPVTTKEDKHAHGFGTKSIRYIVEKYKGNLKYSYQSHIFSLDIFIPLSEQS